MIEKWLSKNEAAIVDRKGKSDIWKLFGQLNVKRKWLVTLQPARHARKFMLLSPTMEVNRLESTTAVKIGE